MTTPKKTNSGKKVIRTSSPSPKVRNKSKKKPNRPKKKSSQGSGKLGSTQWMWIGGLLLLAFIAFFPTLQAEFINYDDDIYITDNPYIVNLNAANLKALFSTYYYNQYSPVAMLIMGMEYQVFSGTLAFKLFSVLLHLFNGFLIFFIVRNLFKKWEFGLIAMLLFAIHPMQVESVAWTTASMKVGMFTAFFLGSMWYYLRYLDTQKRSNLMLAFGLFLLSCFSKEQALALSVVLVLLDYVKGRDLKSSGVWIEKIPFFIVSMIFGFVTLNASSDMETASGLTQYTFLERILFACYAIASYWVKLLAPIKLSAFYTYPMRSSIDFTYYVAPLFVIGLIGATIYAWKKDYKIVVFAIVFFALNLGLTLLSQILATRDVMMADRYNYLPSVGPFVLLAYGLYLLQDRFKLGEKLVYGIFGAYILLLAAGTFQRSKVWQNSISLFSDVIVKAENNKGNLNPFMSLPLNNRGIARKNGGDLKGALADYTRAAEVNPKDHKSFSNRGNLSFLEGNYQAAIQDYNKAIELDPNAEKTYSSRAAAYASMGQYQQALPDIDKALELNPFLMDALRNRASIHFQLKNFEEAAEDTKRYLTIRGGDAAMVNLLGLIYYNMGNNTLALPEMNKSIQMNPDEASFYLNRALVHRAMGNKAASVQDARTAQAKGAQVGADLLN